MRSLLSQSPDLHFDKRSDRNLIPRVNTHRHIWMDLDMRGSVYTIGLRKHRKRNLTSALYEAP